MRLIDANALNTSVALYMAENAYLNDTPLDILKMVSRWIAEAPTIEAVEAVRCRECIHALVFRSGQVSCGYHDWCRIQVKPDGYCDCGEKED